MPTATQTFLIFSLLVLAVPLVSAYVLVKYPDRREHVKWFGLGFATATTLMVVGRELI